MEENGNHVDMKPLNTEGKGGTKHSQKSQEQLRLILQALNDFGYQLE